MVQCVVVVGRATKKARTKETSRDQKNKRESVKKRSDGAVKPKKRKKRESKSKWSFERKEVQRGEPRKSYDEGDPPPSEGLEEPEVLWVAASVEQVGRASV